MVGSVGIGFGDLQKYDTQAGSVEAYANEGLDNVDGRLNHEELTDMLKGIGGDDTDLSDEEVKALADYILSHPYLEEDGSADFIDGTATYSQVMHILDSEEEGGDGDDLIELDDIRSIQSAQDEIFLTEAKTAATSFDDDPTDDTFTLSSDDGSSVFEFSFIEDGTDAKGNTAEEYEDNLASILDVNGSLSKEGLEELLELPANADLNDPEIQAQLAERMSDPMVRSVIAMGLMAVGLEESEVVFVMNQLVDNPSGGLFSVDNLLTIAEENGSKEDEASEFQGVFAGE